MTEAGQSFSQTEILLTGANGFLGKVILGLLLDRFPELRGLHILLRAGGFHSAEARFHSEVLGSPPLTALASRGNIQRKISILEGDVSAPGCGLNPEVIRRLEGRVGLIINCAGRVDFFPPLDDSFRSNVDGVENMIALALRCGAKLLHVSTCFVCGEADGLIEETEPVLGFYPHRRGPGDGSFDPREELLHVRRMVREIYGPDGNDPSRRSRELGQRLAAFGKQRAAHWGWVNTYTYSKSLGEQTIVAARDLEYAIVRPAIVESSWQFPFPGWIEGGRTSAPLVLMALGGQKDWPVRPDAPLEVVPVDMVASAILAVAALLLQGRQAPVYQLGSADINPVELGSIVEWLDAEAQSRQDGAPWLGQAIMGRLAGAPRKAKIRFVSEEEARARRLKREEAAARLERRVEAVAGMMERARLPGRRQLQTLITGLRKLSLQSKFREHTLGQYLPFVLQNRYIFECENIRNAYESLSLGDRKLLPWRPEEIQWKDYWIHHQIAGIEKWVQPEAVREWAFRI